jgi:hypothetical protein
VVAGLLAFGLKASGFTWAASDDAAYSTITAGFHPENSRGSDFVEPHNAVLRAGSYGWHAQP